MVRSPTAGFVTSHVNRKDLVLQSKSAVNLNIVNEATLLFSELDPSPTPNMYPNLTPSPTPYMFPNLDAPQNVSSSIILLHDISSLHWLSVRGVEHAIFGDLLRVTLTLIPI